MTNNIQIPRAFLPLIQEKKRYKVYYGGRGGAKSHNIARALLILGMQSKQRILCARELQASIKESVHMLLADIIASNEQLSAFYKVQKQEIIGLNGSLFMFKGLKYNATEIKSTEGVDRVWVEEAEKVSDASWEVLIPTIRKPGSEIWVSFNPKFATDPTYQRMITDADHNMFVKKVSYRDNPFFPDVLEQERVKLKKQDITAYNHVWEGEFDKRFSGHIFAQRLDAANDAGRITTVPHKRGLPVFTAWDLGKSNKTAVWFCQVVGFQPRIIDYYDMHGQDLVPIVEDLQAKPYRYGPDFLPHDSKHERLGMVGSIKEQLQELGREVVDVQLGSISAGILQANKFIDECWFDKDLTRDGRHGLMNYKYKYNEEHKSFSTAPLKDWTSDTADAFRYLSQAYYDGLMTNEPVEDTTEAVNELYGEEPPASRDFMF